MVVPGTARDLGLAIEVGQKQFPEPWWLDVCSSWNIALRCFLSSCSSTVDCFVLERRPFLSDNKNNNH